ncbi:unnamed protein product [Notodromas monacha]|uniref:Uncharacterized protein n=1 Tax=Notodromas monacha TaxID=399045 RepID=A0A7R9BU48_9CRUS|nr:unnamed protein product [Notodromas monacha]CAG0920735.1 unnamed protein product [Notodromas monacha]
MRQEPVAPIRVSMTGKTRPMKKAVNQFARVPRASNLGLSDGFDTSVNEKVHILSKNLTISEEEWHRADSDSEGNDVQKSCSNRQVSEFLWIKYWGNLYIALQLTGKARQVARAARHKAHAAIDTRRVSLLLEFATNGMKQ